MLIEFVSPEDGINPENDNVDVLVHLDDGGVFMLLVATPNSIYWCMDNEGNDYYFGVPPLFVTTLTRRTLEDAVAALLQRPEWLDIYGASRQVRMGSGAAKFEHDGKKVTAALVLQRWALCLQPIIKPTVLFFPVARTNLELRPRN